MPFESKKRLILIMRIIVDRGMDAITVNVLKFRTLYMKLPAKTA